MSNTVDTISTQTELNNFLTVTYPGCTTYNGSIAIIDDNNGIDNIIDLSPLLDLSVVNQNFIVKSNNSLPNLNGLSLTSVGGNLLITDNPLLSEFAGLFNLSSVGNNLEINNNPLLASINEISMLSEIGNNFTISLNPSLIDVDGLTSLDTVFGSIFITNNAGLLNINSLVDIKFIGANLNINNNNLLTECCGIFDIINQNIVVGVINIFNNSSGCNSITEVINNGSCLENKYIIKTLNGSCNETNFCLPISTKIPISNVLGYDFTIAFDPDLVNPTGVVTVSNDLAIASNVDVVQSIDLVNGLMNVTLTFNSSAPSNSSFNGFGDICCITFNRLAAFICPDSTEFSMDIFNEIVDGGYLEENVESGKYKSEYLKIGDISILGFNTNTPDNFSFVTWVDLYKDTYIKFTDNAFLSANSANQTNNARGGENFVIWRNNTNDTIPAGTVIKIESLTASIGICTAGSSSGLNGLAAAGDNIFAYQGAATTGTFPDFNSNTNPTTFNGVILHGLHAQGSSTFTSWRTTGNASATASYLPSELNIVNGNIALASNASRGQYTGTRNTLCNFSDYKVAVNNPANWTTSSGVGTIPINTDPFLVSTAPTQSVITGSTTICQGSSTNLTVNITGGKSPFQLTLFDGTNQIVISNYISGTVIPVTPYATKTYTIVSATDACGRSGTGLSGSATITVNNRPLAKTCKTDDECQSNMGSIQVEVTNGLPPYTISWTPNNGSTTSPQNLSSSGTSLNINGLQGGSTYIINVIDANNCSSQ